MQSFSYVRPTTVEEAIALLEEHGEGARLLVQRALAAAGVEVDLDQALAKFERGLELARQLKSRLKEIENTVENLKAKFTDKA